MVHHHPHHPHTQPTLPHHAHVHELDHAPQYYPEQQQYTNQAYAHPNSYSPKSSSTRGGPLEYRDPNQQHRRSSGHRCRSEPMPQATFPRQRSSNNGHQHKPSRRLSNDSITHHSNHQHDSSRCQSSHQPRHSYGESSKY